jgi:hypothetical protein
VESLLNDPDSLRTRIRWAAGAALVLFLVSLGAAGGMKFSDGHDSESWKSLLDLGQGRDPRNLHRISEVSGHRRLAFEALISALSLAALISGLVGSALVVALRRKGTVPWVAGGLAVLLWLELFQFGGRFFNPTSETGLPFPRELVERLSREGDGPYRIASADSRAMQDIGRSQLAGLDHVGGYNPLLLREYVELIAAIQHRRPDPFATLILPATRHPILRMLGVRTWFSPQDTKGLLPLTGGPANAYIDPTALPRAYGVRDSVVLPSSAERLAFLGDENFDPSRVVVLEHGAAPSPAEAVPIVGEARTTLRDRSPGRYLYEVDYPSDLWLVLSEAWYPGWTATIDGAEVPLFRANHCIQAVRVPSGKHQVGFAYGSRTFAWGCGLALTAAAALAAWVGVARWRSSPP